MVTWNRHAQTLYGRRAEQALGKKLRDLLDPAYEFADESKSFRRLNAGERVAYQREVRRSDGE